MLHVSGFQIKNLSIKIFKIMKINWLEKAVVFDMGFCPYHNRPIKIEKTSQVLDIQKWAFRMQEWVLTKEGEFIYEPLPSSRTPLFLELSRFDSPEEAYKFYLDNVNCVQRLTC